MLDSVQLFQQFFGTYSLVENKVSCSRPGPLDPQSSTLIIRPPHLSRHPLNIHTSVHLTSRILSTVPDLFFFKYILQIIELQAVKELSHIKVQTRVTFKKSILLALETHRLTHNSKNTHILTLYHAFHSAINES